MACTYSAIAVIMELVIFYDAMMDPPADEQTYFIIMAVIPFNNGIGEPVPG